MHPCLPGLTWKRVTLLVKYVWIYFMFVPHTWNSVEHGRVNYFIHSFNSWGVSWIVYTCWINFWSLLFHFPTKIYCSCMLFCDKMFSNLNTIKGFTLINKRILNVYPFSQNTLVKYQLWNFRRIIIYRIIEFFVMQIIRTMNLYYKYVYTYISRCYVYIFIRRALGLYIKFIE